MSPLLGADGRPLLQEAGGVRQCVLCEVERARPLLQRYSLPALDDDAAHYRRVALSVGEAFGYFVGVQLMASVLVGSGLDPDQAVHVQTAASSLCEDHQGLVACAAEAFRRPVEVAIENIRASATFIVGRDGGKVKGVGP